MKTNLIHLLCLCNYSFKNPECDVQLKLNKVLLTSSLDYFKNATSQRTDNLLNPEYIFHDLKTIDIDMKFNMKQYSNSLSVIKKCIKQKKLLYIKPEDMDVLKEKHGISDFQLTIFYHFEKMLSPDENREVSLIRPRSKVHNVLIAKSNKPILVLYNPFQHTFEK